jgi:hypothetical protein
MIDLTRLSDEQLFELLLLAEAEMDTALEERIAAEQDDRGY